MLAHWAAGRAAAWPSSLWGGGPLLAPQSWLDPLRALFLPVSRCVSHSPRNGAVCVLKGKTFQRSQEDALSCVHVAASCLHPSRASVNSPCPHPTRSAPADSRPARLHLTQEALLLGPPSWGLSGRFCGLVAFGTLHMSVVCWLVLFPGKNQQIIIISQYVP